MGPCDKLLSACIRSREPSLSIHVLCCSNADPPSLPTRQVVSAHMRSLPRIKCCTRSGYIKRYGSVLEKKCPGNKYEAFGWCSAISFPFSWASSFGEFCSPQWNIWRDKFNAAEVPVRSCVLHSLNLCPAVR